MIFKKASELKEEGKSFVMVTMTEVVGSAPQEAGAKCIVGPDGLIAGTVGGGKVEAAAIKFAQKMLESSEALPPKPVKWNLQTDIGMTCGGVVGFLFEHFPSNEWPIAIFGAGHVSQALTRYLTKLNCQVSVIDERREWTDRLANVEIINSNDPQSSVAAFNEKTFFLCMTKGHAFDVPFLHEIFKQFPNAPYIGAIGSKSKGNAIRKDLAELGVSADLLERLRIPIGLPIGNNTPEEISISIIAELLQIRDSLA